jgi:hypothetical protein
VAISEHMTGRHLLVAIAQPAIIVSIAKFPSAVSCRPVVAHAGIGCTGARKYRSTPLLNKKSHTVLELRPKREGSADF